MFLLSEDRIDEVFNLLTSFLEEALFQSVIFAQTSRMLKFYHTHLRRKQAKILFLQVEGDMAGILALLSRAPSDLQVVVTDLRDGSQVFSLLEDSGSTRADGGNVPFKVRTARLIDYGSLYNEKTDAIVRLEELADPALKAKHDLSSLYYLKYKVDPITLLPQAKPHLETDTSEKLEE